MNLQQLKSGNSATITSLNNIDSILKKRLIAFGLTEGCQVCLCQKTFFGGPCIIECKGQKLSLRKCDAQLIEVAPQ
ncbi:MAG: ferrous iron transport protein A [Bacillaceae bacterium]